MLKEKGLNLFLSHYNAMGASISSQVKLTASNGPGLSLVSSYGIIPQRFQTYRIPPRL
jgi:hypothetical protein